MTKISNRLTLPSLSILWNRNMTFITMETTDKVPGKRNCLGNYFVPFMSGCCFKIQILNLPSKAALIARRTLNIPGWNSTATTFPSWGGSIHVLSTCLPKIVYSVYWTVFPVQRFLKYFIPLCLFIKLPKFQPIFWRHFPVVSSFCLSQKPNVPWNIIKQ
jgi:hypothetical protein